MGYRRRGFIEILLEIIENAGVSINKTRLMAKANLPYIAFIKYADFLENKGFIIKIPPPRLTRNRGKKRTVKFHYIITNKGIELLNQVSQEPLSEILSYRKLDIMEEM